MYLLYWICIYNTYIINCVSLVVVLHVLNCTPLYQLYFVVCLTQFAWRNIHLLQQQQTDQYISSL